MQYEKWFLGTVNDALVSPRSVMINWGLQIGCFSATFACDTVRAGPILYRFIDHASRCLHRKYFYVRSPLIMYRGEFNQIAGDSSSLNCLLPAIWGRFALVSTWRKLALRLVRCVLNPRRLSKPFANQTPVRELRHVLLGLASASKYPPTVLVKHGTCSFFVFFSEKKTDQMILLRYGCFS